MTTNSISPIQSASMAGLGTFTYNIPVTGRYVIEAKATIPWQTNDAPGAIANPAAIDIENITFVADVAGSLNSTYFTFYTAGNLVGYYVWFNINGAGVDPAVAGLTGIQVAGATGVTASVLAAAARTAIAAAVKDVFITGATTHVIINQNRVGSLTAAANGTASPGFSYSVTQAGSYGQVSGLVITINNGATQLYRIGVQSQTQPSLGGSVNTQCTAADVITVVLSSLANVDQLPNAIKTIINLFPFK